MGVERVVSCSAVSSTRAKHTAYSNASNYVDRMQLIFDIMQHLSSSSDYVNWLIQTMYANHTAHQPTLSYRAWRCRPTDSINPLPDTRHSIAPTNLINHAFTPLCLPRRRIPLISH